MKDINSIGTKKIKKIKNPRSIKITRGTNRIGSFKRIRNIQNIKRTIPNIITLMNLSLGVTAILLSVRSGNDPGSPSNTAVNMLVPASLLILIAAVVDRFDGRIARLMNSVSDFGRELDSLSDLISFGVAPVIIAWKLNFLSLGAAGYFLALIFPLAGAYRLARYNIASFSKVFCGLPITLAGTILSIDNLYNCFAVLQGKYTSFHLLIAIILITLLSYLMVSRLRIRKI
jgi:CDP-diacylglycerol---serine O-phosphatidyltransferase